MSESTAQADPLAGLTGRDYALARRAMLSKAGKKGAAMVTPQSVAASRRPAPVASTPERATAAETAPTSAEAARQDAVETAIDMACALVEEAPAVAESLTEQAGERVRDYCRERRRALSLHGKAALPAKPGGKSSAAGGQSIARQRRLEQSLKGRGDAAPARPSGRVRPAAEAPAKVETGTTLSGQTVTGTQVERTVKVTGNEPGTCRTITGTEYIGSEQFEGFCATKPAPAPAKVGASATSRGQTVSGTEVKRSVKVTGGEAGTCKPVTGTEYLGSEHFGEFCAGKGITSRPDKAPMGLTARRGLAVTGSDEARPVGVTGGEAGAARGITGAQYNDAGVSRLTINGPAKVALTHTVAGRPVSGIEIGRSIKVTGDEAGACRGISGTEYLSNEQFQHVCQTRPEPRPEKVGEAASQGGQRITGNLVERTAQVTGNEPRAEGRITGSQYERGAARGEAPAKVRELRTASGRPLTGLMAGAGFPKLTGDEQGGCQRVTGIEQAGGTAACDAAPGVAVAKVAVTHTLHGQAVSGTPLGRAGRVTGDEPGSHLAISGTPYAASEQIASGCGCQHGTVETGATPLQAHPRFHAPGRPRAMAMSMIPAEPRPESFSVRSPAVEARGRITGTGYGGAGRITGPVNMASGLVSGTPEFRYRDEGGYPTGPRQEWAASGPAAQGERITGEGREAGRRITGDDWGRSERVTGTEGRWAQGRNPTLRGGGRGMGASAWNNKDLEKPEVPLARVTGSSGNAGKGAVITVSGGARG
ncbi:MAG: CsoS2 family carboxysome shell protein [Pseudomonadota bacterium]